MKIAQSQIRVVGKTGPGKMINFDFAFTKFDKNFSMQCSFILSVFDPRSR